ncbi:hypothetical protein KVV02_008480 [Mortierella alpina]|uniref:Phosphatidylglycerol/phosphatidylinositol transfer protein n=1 Tax=Mortierella alpina TaxID=64518 RepID=A0A9P8A5Y1_MORAP|nr:hypothetical protein KVV02_008480 [Mortierella alpina]
MKITASFVAFVALASTAAGQMNYTNCASGPTQFQMTSATWSPSPACIGKDICAVGTGTLDTPIIEGATLSLTARYLGRLVYTDNHDFCAVLAAQGTPCPVAAGAAVLKGCVKIKENVPPNVAAVFKTVAVNGDGGTIFCAEVDKAMASTCA